MENKAAPWKAEVHAQFKEDYFTVRDDWRNKEKRKPSRWAREERWMAAGGPLARGEDIRWDPDVMPHAMQPMDDADNPEVNIIVLWFGRRMGKTEGICTNIIGRTVTDAPDNIISMWPVEDSRDRFSRDVVETTIEATPALRTKFVEAKSRDAGRTIGYKRFHGGSLIINYSGSKSQTKGMAAGVILAHEIDAYPVSSQGEGDPIEKLMGRAEGFDAIKILESTGTIAAQISPEGKKIYHSNIEKWYDLSDQQKWFCPCRKCGALQWLKWEQIRQLDRKSGETIFYLCEKCEVDHSEKQWRRMVGDGQWKPTAPFVDGIRGYWINGFNSLLPKGRGFKTKLHQFFAEGNRAMAARPEVRRVWINEVQTALVPIDDQETQPPPHQPILDGREDYAVIENGVPKIVVPDPALVITTMTDLHGNRLEVEWRAWAPNEESWGLWHHVIYGDTNKAEVWRDWTTHLQHQFTHATGAKIGLTMAFVDGGWHADSIQSTLRRLAANNVPGVSGKIRATKGVPKWASVIHKRWARVNGALMGVHIGTWCAKSLIYERLNWHSAEEKPSAGFIHFGKIYSDEFIRQIVSEKPKFKFVPEINREVETFKNPDQNRNEGLDLIVGNLAAFRYQPHGLWDWEGIRAGLLAQLPQKTSQPTAAPTARRRSSYVSDWR